MNALESMPQAGTLTLRLKNDGLFALMEVEDSGPGFSDEAKANLFKPFFSTKASGTGLGLAFVQKVVFAHGGRLEALNSPSGGAIIRIFLPLLKGES